VARHLRIGLDPPATQAPHRCSSVVRILACCRAGRHGMALRARRRPAARFRQIVQRPYATVRAPLRADGARGRGSRGPHGASSTNRAATLCNRPGADAGGWRVRPFQPRPPSGAFSANRAATLCNRPGADAGGWRVRPCQPRPPSGAFSANRAATLCNRPGADAGRWGAVVPAEAPRWAIAFGIRIIGGLPWPDSEPPRRPGAKKNGDREGSGDGLEPSEPWRLGGSFGRQIRICRRPISTWSVPTL